jgi:hypothetical protein
MVQLAREAGLLKLAAISLDGTRLAGAASKRSVRTLDQIEAELQELESQGAALLAQAEAADRSDPDAGGTQLPPELANAQVRREKLRAAKAQIAERRQRAVEAGRQDGPHSARRTAKGQRERARKPDAAHCRRWISARRQRASGRRRGFQRIDRWSAFER